MLSGSASIARRVQSLLRKHRLETLYQFALNLNAIWEQRGRQPRLGLAISGGVDSMALAFLCQEVTKADSHLMAPLHNIVDYPRTSASFSAFIVDHRMRNGSEIEAKQIATEVAKLGIEPHILRMDWSSRGDPARLTNVETVARTLRYQALGRACRDHSIKSLLFAHHADDQHETVMTRLFSNYLGIGLQGMDSTASIPECAEIYDVDHSGGSYAITVQSQIVKLGARQPIPIESGGVCIWRPLLSLPKENLIKVCQQNGVKWFEDHTNKDPTLTLRNTFRHIIQSNQMPAALSRSRILRTAAKVSQKNNEFEAAATKFFRDTPIKLDLRNGTATFVVPRLYKSLSGKEYRTLTTALRKILDLVSYGNNIPLQHLDDAVQYIFNSKKEGTVPPRLHVGGAEISETSSSSYWNRTFICHRPKPTKPSFHHGLIWFKPEDIVVDKWSEWMLWDSRYWIRVRRPELNENSNLRVGVRFLRHEDLTALKRSVPEQLKNMLENGLKRAKGDLRLTLPAIITRECSDASAGEPLDQIVALPTLNWWLPGWKRHGGTVEPGVWLWDIRYKYVDLDLSGNHRVLS